jgi:predicted nucleic acid-binding protein
MFRGLPTASLPVMQLFDSPYLFTVPAYQRPYSWTTKEAGQLLEDVAMAAGLDDAEAAWPDYFLGAILLLDPEAEGTNPPPAFSGPRVFEVVDGQQRLITLSILASVLRDREDEEGLDLEAAGVSLADRLHALVTVDDDERDITQRRTRVQLRGVEQSFLETHVLARQPRPSLSDDDDAETWPGIRTVFEHLAGEIEALTREERRRLARYVIEDCHVVVMISRDIDRAHRLFTVLNERGKPLERKDILKAEVLRAVAAPDAANAIARWDRAQTQLDDEFENFFGHVRQIYGLQRMPIISGVRALVRQEGSIPFLETVLTPLADAFARVRTFPSSSEATAHPELATALVSLNRLGKADWVPAAMLAMEQYPFDPARATMIAREVERLVYLLRLLCYGAGKRQRRFAAVLDSLRDPRGDIAALPAFEITADEQRTIAYHLKDIHRRNPPMAKLLLMRIEDELAGTPLMVSPSDLTVEHVLPMRPAGASAWRQLFPDGEHRAVCQASLGNLALFGARQNERAKNRDFAEKLAIYREPGQPGLKLNQDILSATDWTDEAIEARTVRLSAVIGKLWRIDVSNPANGNGKRPRKLF